MSFEGARDWCRRHVPGSSLIVINSTDSQRAVEDFLGRQELHVGLANETIIMDARKLSGANSQKWSWVNGHQTIPTNIRGESILDGACVTAKDGQSLVYCKGLVESQYRYICETSDANSTSEFSYRQNNKTYIVSLNASSWYDARQECLRFGGDLASITDLQSISQWSRLKENEDRPYWIGLYRNKWIWNSTGVSLTYTNWDRDIQDEWSDYHCICINPGCMRNSKGNTFCDDNRKWKTCDCNNNYTIVCQKDENSDVSTTENVVTEVKLQSTRRPTTRRNSPTRSVTKRTNSSIITSTTNPFTVPTSTKTTRATTPSTITTSTKTTISTPTITMSTEMISTSTMTQKSSNNFSENQSNALETSSTGFSQSFTRMELLLLILFLFVTVVIIVFVVILIIRKCKKHNEESPLNKTNKAQAISSEYETIVHNKRPSDDTIPIYTELELTQRPTSPNNDIYANVQPSGKAVDMDVNVVYVDPHAL